MPALRPTVTHYLTYCRSRRRSPTTISWYAQKLGVLVTMLEAEGVCDTDTLSMSALTAVIAKLQDRGTSARTAKGYVQVLKGWVHFLAEEELVPLRLFERIKLPAVPHRLVKTLDQETLDALFAACRWEHAPWLATRNRAILRLLLDTGIRASELCTLTMSGLRMDEPGDPHIRVIGKGDKERGAGPLGYETIREMRKYLRMRPYKSDYVFLGRTGLPLTVSGLDQILYRLRDNAGLEGVEIRAHVFRHTFAVTRLRQGWDIKRVSLLLGHASVTTTEVYLRDFSQEEARRR